MEKDAVSEPTPEDKKLAKDIAKAIGPRPPTKSDEQQFVEWVSDAITFDAGDGMKVYTRAAFADLVKIVPFEPQKLLGYSRLFDIAMDTIPGVNIAGKELPAKLRFDVEIRMG